MRVIDLMSGIGGRALAFINSGFEIVCAIDNNKENAKIYCDIVKPQKFLLQNIEDIEPYELPEADIITGKLLYGLLNTNRRGIDSKEKIRKSIYNIIVCKRPMYFVLEAPVVFLTQSNRKMLESMLEKYISAGYKVTYNIFAESEYSGLPIGGKQLFIVGIREDLFVQEFYFSGPKFYKNVNKTFRDEDNIINDWYRELGNIEKIDFIEGRYYIREKKNIRGERYLKESKLIYTGLYRDIFIMDSIGLRRFTHNEFARLKGIQNYNFNDCANKLKMYSKIAYASNVYIVEAIARALIDYLDNKDIIAERLLGLQKKGDKSRSKETDQKKIVFPKHRITHIHIDKLKGIRNLDISISGNLTAIMGVNGSGKSTILHALACVYTPYERGDSYKFSFFFTPNPDSDWKNSKLELTYYDENEQKEISRVYKKDSDRWSPRYSKRPVRDVFFVGIETCIPEIEKEKQTSFIDYSTDSMNDDITHRVVKSAAYILNKDYETLTMHRTKKKELLGVHTANNLTYSSLTMGAGEQRVFKILRLVYTVNTYSLILIDEIDLLLHVTALKRLIMELYQIALKRNLQIIFTTHSLEVVNLNEYVDVRYLEQLEQKTMVYNSVNADMIYEMSDSVRKPIEIYVEDLLAEVIIKRIAEELSILGDVKVLKYGVSANAFTVAASYILKDEKCDNTIIILDGDNYREDEEKFRLVEKVLSGTEKEHKERVKKAVSMIKQLHLPINVAPEKHIFNMLIEMNDSDEIIRYAKKLKAVSNSHQWLDNLVTRIGQNEELVLFRIIEIVSQHPCWGTYIKDVHEWMIQMRRKLKLGVDETLET